MDLTNEMRLVASDAKGLEKGYIDVDLDLEIGEQNDFETRTSLEIWDKEKLDYGNRIYVEGTEYGGLLEEMKVITSQNEIVWLGYTWRGLLNKKVVEPPSDTSHLILNGELNSMLRELVGERFGSLFYVPDIDTGVSLRKWQVDRYVTLHDAIIKMLDSVGYRLQIRYVRAEQEMGRVELQAVKKIDYSTLLRYDQDSTINFSVTDCRRGINHLVCVGEGQNEERIKIDLFVQKDGSIGKTQYYKGLAERTEVYNYTNADAVELEKEGIKKLKELQNYKSANMEIDGLEVEIGDTVTGREKVTDTSVSKPVIGKILKMQNGNNKVEYKLKGDD